jgi:SAM-dependent methyltransferase
VTRSCPLCNCDNTSAPVHPYSQPPWILKRCSGCELVYLENPPDYSALRQEFAWEKTWAAESDRRRHAHPVFYHGGRSLKATYARLFKRDKLVDWVRRYFQPGPVLDVGCAGGHTLERLPKEYVPYGIDVSDELSRRAQERFSIRGGDAVAGNAVSLSSHFAPDFFTGVIMSSFLEHEPNVVGVLTAAKVVMRPAARLIVKVPNYASWNRSVRGAKWCGFRFPDHVNYFTPGLLVRLLSDTGFRVIRFTLAEHFPTSDNMWLLAEKS